MDGWLVNLLVGILSVILGFVGGFFTKSFIYKSKNINTQKAKGKNISQTMKVGRDEK